ncbi:MAG: pilus assembly protein PilM [Candidatus Omnitrophota bacterium]|nr:pilus assembly protein PilM [Candidatus Omnitrophota bacterium]
MPSPQLAEVLASATSLFKRLVTVQPNVPKLTVGLDLGSTSVKVVALGPPKGGAHGPRPLLGHHLVPFDEGATDAVEAIKTAVADLPIPVQSVNLSVSGQWVIMRILELPAMKPAEVRQTLPYEAQRYLPFPIQDVVIDGAILGPAGPRKIWVLIVACKKELVERRIDWARRAGLEPALIDVDALALANAFTAQGDGRKPQGTRVLIHAGAQLTHVVILRHDAPYLVRDLPWGGEKCLRSVAEQLGLEVAAVKETLARGETTPELLNALKLAAEPLVTELQLSFDYFENQFGKPPEEALISGGLGQLAGFVEGLKGALTQPVTAWTPARELSAQFAVAYGLALRC